MNFKEIVETLKSCKTYRGLTVHGPNDIYHYFLDKDEISGLGKIKVVYSEGSASEGSYSENDDYSGAVIRVVHFIDHNVYVKFDGRYASYEGLDFPGGWDNLQEVFPQEETIIVYKPKGKMTFEQLKIILKKHYNDVDDFAFNDSDGEISGLGKFQMIDKYGGEGDGSKWYNIRYFVEHDIYVQVSGYYQSYVGVEFGGWDDVTEVKPQERTITVYEPII